MLSYFVSVYLSGNIGHTRAWRWGCASSLGFPNVILQLFVRDSIGRWDDVYFGLASLDRQISIILGRPFAISNREIDVEEGQTVAPKELIPIGLELPYEVDEDATKETLKAYARGQAVTQSWTSMSCLIHTIKLRRIESQIQQSVYRIDKSSNLSSVTINRFMQDLDLRKSRILVDDKPTGYIETKRYNGTPLYVWFTIVGSAFTLISSDGVLLQMPAPTFIFMFFRGRYKYYDFAQVCWGLWWGMQNLLEAPSPDTCWLLADGIILDFPSRCNYFSTSILRVNTYLSPKTHPYILYLDRSQASVQNGC
jgi:hypothetical protein